MKSPNDMNQEELEDVIEETTKHIKLLEQMKLETNREKCKDYDKAMKELDTRINSKKESLEIYSDFYKQKY